MSGFREARPGRRSAARQRRREHRMLLLVCGAKVTEKDYFNGLRDHYRSSNVRVKIITEPKSPEQVVEKAAQLFAAEPDSFDECWAIVDVDSFDIQSAIEASAANGVNLAISNPCFEFWLLLHFTDYRKALTDYKATAVQLKKYRANYDKAKVKFSDYATGVPLAVARAQLIDQKSQAPHQNPSSGVWKIVSQILPAEE